MVDVDGAFHISILVDHLVFIQDAADAVGPLLSRSELGGALWWSSQSENEASYLVGVSSWRRRRSGHLLVGELEPLLDGLDVYGWVLSGERGIGIQVKIWRKRWLTACRNHGGRESVRFMRHSVEGQHNSWDLVNPCLGGGSFKQTSTEHIIEGPMAPFVDCIAFRMVGGSENLLDSQ